MSASESISESGVGKMHGVDLLPVASHKKTTESRSLGGAMGSGSGGRFETSKPVEYLLLHDDLLLHDITNSTLRGKVVRLGSVAPWATVLVRRDALLQFKGNFDDVAALLTIAKEKPSVKLISDGEDDLPLLETGSSSLTQLHPSTDVSINGSPAPTLQSPNDPIISTFDGVTGNLEQFALFPKLPPELRDHIWKCTLEPRLVIVFAGPEYAAWYPQLWGSSTQAPAILSVCSGSRKVALKEHKWLSKDASHQKIYFVPSLDTVYFKGQFDHRHERVSEFFGEAGSDIQSLAIEHDWDDYCAVATLYTRGFNFSRHKDLKELILVRRVDLKIIVTSWGHFSRGGYHVYRIDGLRPVTAEEEFDNNLPRGLQRSTDFLNSKWIQKKITDYIEAPESYRWSDVKSGVGSPDGPLPAVKVLIEVVEEPIARSSRRRAR